MQFPMIFYTFVAHNNLSKMKATEQTLQQIERAIRKVSEKFPPQTEASVMTDIHLRVTQDTGELMAFNDDDVELNRCIVEDWIDNKDDNFYEEIVPVFRKCLEKMKDTIDNMSILKPFSFVLVDDDRETVAELMLFDDDNTLLSQSLMQGLDEELDSFLKDLLAE